MTTNNQTKNTMLNDMKAMAKALVGKHSITTQDDLCD